MIANLEEQLKKMQGDEQTSQRSLKIADRQIERARVKSGLTQITAKAKSSQDTEKIKLAERVASIIDKATFLANFQAKSDLQGKSVPAPKKKKK